MPSGFRGAPAGAIVRRKDPVALNSAMVAGMRTLPMMKWSVPGRLTIPAGVANPLPSANVVFVGAVVTRWAAFAQSAALDGKGGENFVMRPAAGSGT